MVPRVGEVLCISILIVDHSILIQLMTQAREDNHFLSLLKSVFREKANSLIFRPYQGSTATWGRVTFREYEAHLSIVAQQRSQQWSNFGIENGDVVGVWYAVIHVSDRILTLSVIITQAYGLQVRGSCQCHWHMRCGLHSSTVQLELSKSISSV